MNMDFDDGGGRGRLMVAVSFKQGGRGKKRPNNQIKDQRSTAEMDEDV